MRSFQIQDQNAFMTKLLMNDTFDQFQLLEASITTYATFQVDGAFHAQYFGDEPDAAADEPSAYAYWRRVRPTFYQLTRGRHTPLRFRISLKLAPHSVDALLAQTRSSIPADQIGGIFLNVLFDGTSISLTSGLSFKTFSMDRSLEHSWDDMAERFLRKISVSFLVC